MDLKPLALIRPPFWKCDRTLDYKIPGTSKIPKMIYRLSFVHKVSNQAGQTPPQPGSKNHNEVVSVAFPAQDGGWSSSSKSLSDGIQVSSISLLCVLGVSQAVEGTSHHLRDGGPRTSVQMLPQHVLSGLTPTPPSGSLLSSKTARVSSSFLLIRK